MVKQPIILDRYIGMLYMNQQSWDITSLGVIGDTIPKRSGLEDCGLQIYWRVEEWGDRIFFLGIFLNFQSGWLKQSNDNDSRVPRIWAFGTAAIWGIGTGKRLLSNCWRRNPLRNDVFISSTNDEGVQT